MPHPWQRGRRRRRWRQAPRRFVVAAGAAAALVRVTAAVSAAARQGEQEELQVRESADAEFLSWAESEASQADMWYDARNFVRSPETPYTDLGVAVLQRTQDVLLQNNREAHVRIYIHRLEALNPSGGNPLPQGHLCSFELSPVYGVELWVLETLLELKVLHAATPEEADYVYFPHCATVAYFLLQAPYIRHVRAGDMSHTTMRNDSNQAQFLSPVVSAIDRHLLAGVFASRVMRSTAYKACKARRPAGRCRPLFVNFLGRHWTPMFSAKFSEAVFITHAAESDWLSRGGGQALYYQGQGHPHGGARLQEPAPSGAETESAEANAYFQEEWPLHSAEPPTAQQDIPLPLPVHAVWTRRSRLWHGRTVLASFAGLMNSPVRQALFRLFGDAAACSAEVLNRDCKDQASKKVVSAGARKPKPSAWYLDHGRWRRGLLPRPDVQLYGTASRLRIMDASELMYRSRLCLVPDGDQPNTQRLVEAAAHGCVPLVISSRWLPPFRRLISWSECAVFLPEEQVVRLPELLDELANSPGLLEAMHGKLKAVAQALVHGGFQQQSSGFPIFLVADLGQRREDGVVRSWEHRTRQSAGLTRSLDAGRPPRSRAGIRLRPHPGERVREFKWYTAGGDNSSGARFWERFLFP